MFAEISPFPVLCNTYDLPLRFRFVLFIAGTSTARVPSNTEAQRAPADLISRMADPTADVAGVEGKKGKKAARAGAAGAAAEPVEVVSKFRKDPEAEMVADGVHNVTTSLRTIKCIHGLVLMLLHQFFFAGRMRYALFYLLSRISHVCKCFPQSPPEYPGCINNTFYFRCCRCPWCP